MDIEARMTKHEAAFEKISADLTDEERARLTSASDQLDALVEEVTHAAGGMLHHMYRDEPDARDQHYRQLGERLTDLQPAELITLAGRLAILVASYRFTFEGE